MWFIGKHQLPCIIDARRLRRPGGKKVMEDAVARLSKHPSPDLANICGPAESAARQLGRLGSPVAKEVMEDAAASHVKASLP